MLTRSLIVFCTSAALMAGLLATHVSFLCSMTGLRQSHCCCPLQAGKAGEQAPGGRVTAVCCERAIEIGQGPPATAQARDADLIAAPPGPLLALVPAPRSYDSQRVRSVRAARGPPPGPPVYLRTCRHLI